MQYQKGLVLSITILFFSGCSTTSPMKVALTELGTSSKSEYGVYGVRYMRSINITGMAPEETVGSISIDPDKLSIAEQLKRLNLNPKDLPDTITPRLNIGPSVIYERTFCNPGSVDARDKCPTSEDIINIKNVINLQERFIAKLSSAQIKLKVLELISKAITNKPAETDKFLNLLKLEFQDSKSLNDANQSNYQTKINETEELLKNEIKIIENELDKNKKSIDKPGIIVTNWKFESDLSADGGLPGLNGAVSKSKDSFGYAILGNPIIVSLHLGSDIRDWDVFKSEDKNTNLKKLLEEKRL